MWLACLCAFVPGTRGWAPASPQLLTEWAKLVNPDHAHPEHPRPDAWREGASWQSLNGLWEADASPKDLSSPPFGSTQLPSEILVPFPFLT